MVIPIENIVGYSGDWIVWFAERDQKPGGAPTVRAPIPMRKFESVDPVPPGARTEIRVQIEATITERWKVRSDSAVEGSRRRSKARYCAT